MRKEYKGIDYELKIEEMVVTHYDGSECKSYNTLKVDSNLSKVEKIEKLKELLIVYKKQENDIKINYHNKREEIIKLTKRIEEEEKTLEEEIKGLKINPRPFCYSSVVEFDDWNRITLK